MCTSTTYLELVFSILRWSDVFRRGKVLAIIPLAASILFSLSLSLKLVEPIDIRSDISHKSLVIRYISRRGTRRQVNRASLKYTVKLTRHFYIQIPRLQAVICL